MKRLILTAILAGASALAATLPSRAVLSGECCPGTVWTPDSKALLFLDGPPARASTGFYEVAATGGEVTRRFSSIAYFSPKLRWAVRPGSGEATVLERLADGKRFTLPTYGADVTWNDAEDGLAYTRSDTSGNYDRRATRVYVADAFGSPRNVATLYGGGVSGWVDDDTLLLSGKSAPGNRDRELFTLNIRSGAKKTLRTALGFRGISLSPDGARVLYTISFDSAARNGLWLQNTAGSTPTEINDYGAYRWRDAGRFLLMPLKTDGDAHVLRQYTVSLNGWNTLGNLGDQVRQGDWSVSPDGKLLNFLSAKDGNVRVLTLP
ncbi:TolB family protein [Deinococcus sp. SM5_A1]|uniref:TolB family protein n=1 Tax=Deinococcus sp. SM5_A1 TaxID=3379094 RepID=UPI00385A3524